MDFAERLDVFTRVFGARSSLLALNVSKKTFKRVVFLGKLQWQVAREMARAKRVQLVAEGIDTVANISMNGVLVGTTDNMFQRYVFDVTELLHPDDNVIEVSIESPLRYAAERYDGYAAPPDGIPPNCPYMHGFCHGNMIRKEPCSFGCVEFRNPPLTGSLESISDTCASPRDFSLEMAGGIGAWLLPRLGSGSRCCSKRRRRQSSATSWRPLHL